MAFRATTTSGGIMHSCMSIDCFLQASRARTKQPRHICRNANFTDSSLCESYLSLPLKERYASAMGEALRREPIMLFPDERLVGMLIQTGDISESDTGAPDALRCSDYIRHAKDRLKKGNFSARHAIVGSPGHITWNWAKVLTQGISGILAELSVLLDKADDEDQRSFYRSAIIAWNSVVDWNKAHLSELKKMREGAAESDRVRLDELIRIVEKVPYCPADSFHEALQSFHMQHLAVMFENPFGGNGPGRMDMILGPYLEKDLASGRITRSEARHLIDELFIRFEERLAFCDGWVESVMVGGKTPDGESCLNTLSYIIIESFLELEQTHPAVYPRICKDDPADYWKLCSEYMVKGKNRGQLYNDEVCISALKTSGVRAVDAVDYSAGGCMEMGIQGKSSDLNFAFTCNIGKICESVLFRHPLQDFHGFEDLYCEFVTEVEKEFKEYVRAIDITAECMAAFRPTALLSTLLEDCSASGRDQHDGGARYPDYGFAILDLVGAADSLWTIRQAVYEEGFVSLEELVGIMRQNYHKQETLRLRLRQLPKYGEGDRRADGFCQRVMADICAKATKIKNRFGAGLKPMIFNFLWTVDASRELQARADGSFAGDYINHGMTPQSFAMNRGLTTAMSSCASLDFSVVAGGATTMWDIDHEAATPEVMESLIRSFFKEGGMIFQGNMTSVAELEAAISDREKYPGLIVRVGGFSAHFSSLSEEICQEIINRHRHVVGIN